MSPRHQQSAKGARQDCSFTKLVFVREVRTGAVVPRLAYSTIFQYPQNAETVSRSRMAVLNKFQTLPARKKLTEKSLQSSFIQKKVRPKDDCYRFALLYLLFLHLSPFCHLSLVSSVSLLIHLSSHLSPCYLSLFSSKKLSSLFDLLLSSEPSVNDNDNDHLFSHLSPFD